MTPSWLEVNAAVLAVLGGIARPAGSNGRPSREPLEVFVDRLFSLRHAEALADGLDEVRVAPGTVVTPMARDLLRRRRIPIRVVSGREAERSSSAHRGEWGFAIESRSGQVEAVRRILLEDWLEVGSDPAEAAGWVSGGEARGAFVLTDEASVAAWRAGRVDGIRAATVAEPEAVGRAVRHLGANLIVAESAGKSIYMIKQLAERFRRGGAPVAPDWAESASMPAGRARWGR